jgi:hypothetical protein
MRQLTLYVLLSLAVCLAVASASVVGDGGAPEKRLRDVRPLPPWTRDSSPVPHLSRDTGSPVALLRGYRHRSEQGIDTRIGRIWKDYGPSIDYDIGFLAGNYAQGYAEDSPASPTIRLETSVGIPLLVVMDEKRDAMIVSVFPGNFHVRNVRSRRDVIEALTMINTFERETQQSQAVSKARPQWLLPGYQHEPATGMVIDSVGGRIWKDSGPDISYQITVTARDKARVYAEENLKASLTVLEAPTTGEVVVALDEEHGAMVVGVDRRAHFMATNVRSRQDAVEVILIATAAGPRFSQ